MNFSQLASERYSVRKYKKQPIDETKIADILAVAQNAPTACNNQPQRIFVVTSGSGRNKIMRSTECHFNAPAFFVVCYDRNESWHRAYDQKDYGMADATIVLTQMMLKIHELGLGSCFVAWFDPEKLCRELQLPENIIPVGILPCGYPADDSAPVKLHFDKKPLSKIVSWL